MVLHEVVAVEERRHADPLHPSPPIWDSPGDRAYSRLIHQQHQGVAADARRRPGSRAAGLVELLCGQPEQKYGTRLTSGSSRADAGWPLERPPPGPPGGHPAPQRAGDHVGVQLAVGRDEL